MFVPGKADDRDETIDARSWHGVPVKDGMHIHDFTYEADYGTVDEAAAILGRMYGPVASTFVRDREQSTLTWRLRIASATLLVAHSCDPALAPRIARRPDSN